MSKKVDIEETLNSIKELSPSVQILAKAEQALRNTQIDLESLIKILDKDPILTANIIKVSNSSYYSLAQPSTSLLMSVHCIGFQGIVKIISMLVSKDVSSRALKHYGMSDIDYWSESISIALFMDNLKKFIPFLSGGSYTIGLLSTIGKLAINQALDNIGSTEVYDKSLPLNEWEEKTVGFNHAQVGARILKEWEFPIEIISVVENQFSPEANDSTKDTAYLLNFARNFVDQLGNGFIDNNIEFNDDMETFMANHDLPDTCIDAVVNMSRVDYENLKRELDIVDEPKPTIDDIKPAEEATPEEKTDNDESSEDAASEEKSDDDKPAEDAKPEEKADDDKPAEVTKPEGKADDDKPAEDTKPEEKTDDDKPAEDTKPEGKTDDDKPAEDAKPEEKSDDDKPAEDTKPEEKTDDDDPSKDTVPEEKT